MVSDKQKLDFGTDFEESVYKSCFARSVAVNSQFHQNKCQNIEQFISQSLDGDSYSSLKIKESTSAVKSFQGSAKPATAADNFAKVREISFLSI